MKKIFKILGFCLFVFMLGFSGQVFAEGNTNGFDNLYFDKGNTKKLDYEVEYIKNNYERMFSSDDFTNKNISEFTIGEPIVIYSIYKEIYLRNMYPVFYNGKCISLIRVLENSNGELTWQQDISGIFLDKINELRGKSGLYRIEVKETTGSPEINIVKLTNRNRSSNDDIVKFSNELFKIPKEDIISREVESRNNDKKENRSANYPYKKLLPFVEREKQGDKPWCAEYFFDDILSYDSEDIKFSDIIECIYPTYFWEIFVKPNLDVKDLSRR